MQIGDDEMVWKVPKLSVILSIYFCTTQRYGLLILMVASRRTLEVFFPPHYFIYCMNHKYELSSL